MATGTRYVEPPQVAWILGAIAPGALLNFYITGTTTRANTYSDIGLTVANANPVVADGYGVYPNIFLDPTVTYEVVQTDSLGANTKTYDPVSSNVAAITAGLGLGTAAFVNTGTSGATVPLLNTNLTFAGNNSHTGFETLAGGAAITPQATPLSADVGYMGWPQNAKSGAYAFLSTDFGKNIVFSVTATATIPLNLASASGQLGQLLRATWPSGFVGTLAGAAGVTIRLPTGNLTGPRTVTGPGFIVLEQMFLNEYWVVGGANVT